jgi:hypothetical protein
MATVFLKHKDHLAVPDKMYYLGIKKAYGSLLDVQKDKIFGFVTQKYIIFLDSMLSML